MPKLRLSVGVRPFVVVLAVAGVLGVSFAGASVSGGGGGGTDTIGGGGGTDTIGGGDVIEGTSGDDQLSGTNGGDVIEGMAGDDRIDGRGGNDTMRGGPGRDVLLGRNGADKIEGGSGRDQIGGGGGNDEVKGGGGNDRLFGNSGNDTLEGEGGSDRMYGGSGSDILRGGPQADLLIGDPKNRRGNDKLYGDAGKDVIDGRRGNDEIYGGPHRDRIGGGPGEDMIDGGPGRDTIYGNSGNDTITHVYAENKNVHDGYSGGSGNDTLRLVISDDDLEALGTSAEALEDHFNETAPGRVRFKNLDIDLWLTVVRFEEIEILDALPDTTSNDIDDPQSAASATHNHGVAIGTDGNPIVSHNNTTTGGLRITHCGNPACTSSTGRDVYDPDNGDLVGQSSSIAIGTDGNPIVAHSNKSTGGLLVTHCSDPTCTEPATTTTITNPGNPLSAHPAIAIGADGNAVIADRSTTTFAVSLTRCLNQACTEFASEDLDHPTDLVGIWISLAIGADGNPIMAHRNQSAQMLRITRCHDTTCSTHSSADLVDGDGDEVGQWTSTAIGTDGNPVISHLNSTASALRFTRCENPECTSHTSADLDSNATIDATAIAIGSDGNPIITHKGHKGGLSSGPQVLRVTHCDDPACTTSTSASVDDLDNDDDVGNRVEMAIGADGNPLVIHRNTTANRLRVTDCGDPTCGVGELNGP